ncbi:MAG: phage integrase N-terminal SAM-like domain-containing protein, partial [Gammaproteobacteria bacterium]
NENKKEPWQKKQVIDSLRLLFKGIHSPLYLEVDWDYWKSSCQDLGKDHDTNYRSTHTIESQTKPSPSSPVQSQQEQEAASNEIDRLRKALRRKNSSIRTEKSYTDWVKQFLIFNAYKNSTDVDCQGVIAYLEYLAIHREVAPKTQSLTLNAISFYFNNVLGREIGDISQFVRAKPREKLPVVLTQEEVSSILNELNGVQWLVVSLLYGGGLRIMEAIRLRVQDIDFGFNQIIVRDGKGNKDRVVPLPTKLIIPLKDHLTEVKKQHADDIDKGFGKVYMPHGLVKKYGKSDQQWVWLQR